MCGHVVKPNFLRGGTNQLQINDNLELGPNPNIRGDHMHGRDQGGSHSLPLQKVPLQPDGTAVPANAKLLNKEVKQIADKVNAKYTRMQRAFTELDTDKSGFLEKLEFMEAVKNFNLMIPFEHMMQIIDASDKDGDGRISYSEFCETMRRFDSLG